jgi:hypothetical protein
MPGLILMICQSSFLTTGHAATHVTATYDLGANPQVMTTAGGQPQYGLVFAQRNKSVTYNSVEYSPSIVAGYLNASGQLNDGAGNLWLDLVPNLGATPGDSYYVVTFNIQGRVHAEIWVLPDVASVPAEAVRQSQPPSATASTLDLARATGLLSLAHGGTNQSAWTAGRCVRVNDAGSGLESAADDCGTGGGESAHNLLSSTHPDTVESAPTRGAILTGQGVSPTRWAAMPKGGQFCVVQAGALDIVCEPVDLTQAAAVIGILNSQNGGTGSAYTRFAGPSSPVKTYTLPNFNATLEYQANKDAANGYAGLTASTKLNAAQGQEVWSSADLTDFASKSGSGTTILGATISAPSSTHYLGWSGSDWVNRTISAGDLPSHQHAAGDITSGTFGLVRGGTNQTSWTASRCVRVNDAGTALESAPADCGSGGGSHNLLSSTHTDTVAASAVLGDMLYANATPSWTKLAGNTSSTKKFLTQTGTGAVSAAPAWGTIAATDLPSSVVHTNQSNTYSAGAQDFGAATSLKVPASAAAAPAASGLLAYDTTANQFRAGVNGTAAYLVQAAAALSSGKLVQGAGSGAVSDSGLSAVAASGSNGVGPRNAGNASTLARSDHDHRSLHTMSWHFPGTPATGVQPLTLTLPEGVQNIAITDLRVTVSATSAASSAFNLQRCTAGCTGTSPTFANIYSSDLSLAANTRTSSKGAAPDQNVSGLAGGDQFRANLVTIGSSLADVTVTMTLKYDTTN